MPPLAFSQTPGSSFERLGQRVQRLICSPHVQKVQMIDVLPEPSETLGDWNRLIEDLEGTHGVRVERLESGAFRIGWREFIEII